MRKALDLGMDAANALVSQMSAEQAGAETLAQAAGKLRLQVLEILALWNDGNVYMRPNEQLVDALKRQAYVVGQLVGK